MFIVIKVILYLFAAHVFMEYGFSPEKKLFEFTALMSVIILMDVVSYFGARHTIMEELNEDEEDE